VRTLLFFLASTLGTAAHAAAEWIKIGGNSQIQQYIDANSITASNVGVKAWIKSEWVKPRGAMKAGERMLAYTEFNCRDKTYSGLQTSVYRLDGTVHEQPTDRTPKVPVPDSFVETQMIYVCSTPFVINGHRGNWALVETRDSTVIAEVEKSSFRTVAPDTFVWFRLTFKTKRNDVEPGDVILSRVAIKCATQQARPTTVIVQSARNGLGKQDMNDDFAPIAPNIPSAAVFKYACNYKP
jgi:hypothetical protein